MNIILFGPPGAGKGTQANNIVNDFKLKKISTGDLLRDKIKNQSSIGKKIDSIISRGKFVSDELVYSLIEKNVTDPKNFNKLIFDGYPRNLSQTKSLEKLLNKFKQKISVVFSLTVRKDVILKRITGRISCSNCFSVFNTFFNPPTKNNHNCDEKYLIKRSDDNLETITGRFETYMKETQPILDFYKKKGSLHEIDGNKEIDAIYHSIRAILDNIRD